MTKQSSENGVALLRKQFKASEIGRALGITPQAVSQWDKVPAERIVELEGFTGIPREKLRPDLYRSEAA